MFENYEKSRHIKMPPWAGPLLIGVLAFHVALLFGIWAKSVWAIEKLELPAGGIEIGAAAPPPPPPPLKGGAKPKDPTKPVVEKKKIVKNELVQPTKQPEKTDTPEEKTDDADGPGTDPDGDINGDINGVKGGVAGGVVDGVGQGPPPPPPPPVAPQNVAPTALEQQRISGEKNIVPEDVTKTEIQRSGKTKIVGSFKICLNTGGGVQNVQMLKSTGFAAYDQKIQREMRSWRYRPFLINGKAAPVCTAVTFIYSQK